MDTLHLLLLLAVAALFVFAIKASAAFTKGPVSVTALTLYLQRLQVKFAAGAIINPEEERNELETLLNSIKTKTDPATLSGNAELQVLLAGNRQSVNKSLLNLTTDGRTPWIKLHALVTEFEVSYFSKAI